MRTINAKLIVEDESLLNGVNLNAIKVLDTEFIRDESSVLGKMKVFIPQDSDSGDTSQMTREQIADWLRAEFECGNLVSRSSRPPVVLKKLIFHRKMSPTALTKVVVKGDSVGNEVYSKVSSLISGNRVHDANSVSVARDYRSYHEVQKACSIGEIMRFDYDDTVLYID